MTQLEMITSTELSGSGMLFDLALEELDVLHAGFALIFPRQRQHLVGHVEAIGLAGWADALGREQHVDAAARTQVEHGLARIQLRQRRRIAASQRGLQRLFGNLLRLRRVVEIRGDRDRSNHPARRMRRSRKLPPVWTRNAACPYFSLTTSLMLGVLMAGSYLHKRNDVLGFDCFVAGATFGVKEAEQLLQASVLAVYQRKVPSRRTFTRSSFFSLSRWCESVELGMSNSLANLAGHHSLRDAPTAAIA